jgi:hypothetical protein
VEAGDQITITPVEVADKPIEKPSQNEPKENNLGGKNNNLNGSARKLTNESEKKVVEWIIQIFKEKDIKEIRKENGELIITHNNNNKIVSAEQKNNDRQLKNIENYLVKSGENSLKLEELQRLLNNSKTPQNSISNNNKTDYTPYLVGGAIGIAILALI